MIRLTDHTVVVSIRQIVSYGLDDFPIESMAHEIGHHVYCPGDLNDLAKVLTRTRAGLPTQEHLAPFVANLNEDLMINDRLSRGPSLNMAGVYQQMIGGHSSQLWTFYMRMYEVLWSLPTGTLATEEISPAKHSDARLAARLIRAYRKKWLEGAGRFACLCFPYLLKGGIKALLEQLKPWLDTETAGENGDPMGLVEVEADELDGAIHPAADPDLNGALDQSDAEAKEQH